MYCVRKEHYTTAQLESLRTNYKWVCITFLCTTSMQQASYCTQKRHAQSLYRRGDERRATPGFQCSDEWSLDWHSQWYSRNNHHSKKFSLSRNTFSNLFRAFSRVEPSIPVSIFVRWPMEISEVRFGPNSEYGLGPLPGSQKRNLSLRQFPQKYLLSRSQSG